MAKGRHPRRDQSGARAESNPPCQGSFPHCPFLPAFFALLVERSVAAAFVKGAFAQQTPINRKHVAGCRALENTELTRLISLS